MGFFGKRRTAAAVFVVVIIVFGVIGVNLSASRVYSRAEKQFYDGVFAAEGNYTESAIENHLEKRIDAALGLITVLAKEPEFSDEVSALREAREELISAKTVKEKFLANEKLEGAYLSAANAMPDEKKSESAAKSYLSTLSGAQTAILKSSYNDETKKANASVLPGVLYPLRLLVFSEQAELFEQ